MDDLSTINDKSNYYRLRRPEGITVVLCDGSKESAQGDSSVLVVAKTGKLHKPKNGMCEICGESLVSLSDGVITLINRDGK